MSDSLPADDSGPPKKRSRRWWVRLVHPIGWTFWLVTMPLVALFNLWLVLFCPWVGDFDHGFELSEGWKFRIVHTLKPNYRNRLENSVTGYVDLGPMRIGHAAKNTSKLLVVKERFLEDADPHFSSHRYHWKASDDDALEQTLYVTWQH